MNGEKFCPNCGTKTPEHATFCPNCGGAFPNVAAHAPQPQQPQYAPQPQPQYAPRPVVADYSNMMSEEAPKENVVLGILGAAIFALGGGVVHFLFYWAGIISALSGVVAFFLADLGYGLFSGNKKSKSIVKYIAEGVLFLGIIFVAHYLSVAFSLYDEGFCESFTSAIRLMPDFLEIKEVSDAFVENLLFAYVFGIVYLVINAINARKNNI